MVKTLAVEVIPELHHRREVHVATSISFIQPQQRQGIRMWPNAHLTEAKATKHMEGITKYLSRQIDSPAISSLSFTAFLRVALFQPQQVPALGQSYHRRNWVPRYVAQYFIDSQLVMRMTILLSLRVTHQDLSPSCLESKMLVHQRQQQPQVPVRQMRILHPTQLLPVKNTYGLLVLYGTMTLLQE